MSPAFFLLPLAALLLFPLLLSPSGLQPEQPLRLGLGLDGEDDGTDPCEGRRPLLRSPLAMLRDDYVMKQVEQLGRAVARVAGLCREEAYEEALDEVRQALGDALGPRASLVETVDAATAVSLLGSPVLVTRVAKLLAEEARALDGLGAADEAEARRARAADLLRAISELDERGRALLARLKGQAG